LQFQGDFTSEFSRERVWQFINNVEEVAKCFPGFKSIEKTGENTYKLVARVGIGFIKGDFIANLSLENVNPIQSMTLKAKGTGMGSTVDLAANINLDDEGNQTLMKWVADVKVGGTLASIGARLIEGAAQQIISELFECIKKKLA